MGSQASFQARGWSQKSMAMEELGFELDLLALDLLAQEHCPTSGIYQLHVVRKCKLRGTEGPSRGFKRGEVTEAFLSSQEAGPLCQQAPSRVVA